MWQMLVRYSAMPHFHSMLFLRFSITRNLFSFKKNLESLRVYFSYLEKEIYLPRNGYFLFNLFPSSPKHLLSYKILKYTGRPTTLNNCFVMHIIQIVCLANLDVLTLKHHLYLLFTRESIRPVQSLNSKRRFKITWVDFKEWNVHRRLRFDLDRKIEKQTWTIFISCGLALSGPGNTRLTFILNEVSDLAYLFPTFCCKHLISWNLRTE